MVLKLEILQQYIDRNSTQQQDHKIWNEPVQSSWTVIKLSNDVGLSKSRYRVYELFWILKNEKEIPNIRLKRTCQINNCISHYNEIQYNIDSIVEMDVDTYIDVCERFDKYCEPDNQTTCVNWTGNIDKDGYGRFCFLGK